MTPEAWIALSVAVIAVTFVVFATFAIRTLIQIRRTAAEVEHTVRRAQPLLTELEATTREVRSLSGQVTQTVERMNHVVGSLETVSARAASASNLVLGGLGGQLGRAAALWSAVRTGTDIFRKILGRNHKVPRRSRAGASAPAEAARDS